MLDLFRKKKREKSFLSQGKKSFKVKSPSYDIAKKIIRCFKCEFVLKLKTEKSLFFHRLIFYARFEFGDVKNGDQCIPSRRACTSTRFDCCSMEFVMRWLSCRNRAAFADADT
jgi:hypothetical protein